MAAWSSRQEKNLATFWQMPHIPLKKLSSIWEIPVPAIIGKAQEKRLDMTIRADEITAHGHQIPASIVGQERSNIFAAGKFDAPVKPKLPTIPENGFDVSARAPATRRKTPREPRQETARANARKTDFISTGSYLTVDGTRKQLCVYGTEAFAMKNLQPLIDAYSNLGIITKEDIAKKLTDAGNEKYAGYIDMFFAGDLGIVAEKEGKFIYTRLAVAMAKIGGLDPDDAYRQLRTLRRYPAKILMPIPA